LATIPRPEDTLEHDADIERPDTAEEAFDFLRRYAKVSTTWDCDVDHVKIQMTVEDEELDKYVFSRNRDFAPGDPRKTNPSQLIKLARQAYIFKKNVEAGTLPEDDVE